MEKKRILCYGDSNTWGYISGSDHKRYSNERWTRILAKKLGDKFEIIEEGLNSRTLLSNELKYSYNKNAEEIGEMFEEYFVKTILNRKSQIEEKYPKLLIITPPIVNEYAEHFGNDNKYKGATEKSKKLNNIYEKIASKYDCYFLSNEGLETGIDGIHLTKESHEKLANSIAKKIENILNI